jgi:hypothetical protein
MKKKMAGKEAELNIIDVDMSLTDRARIREEMLVYWMREDPGTLTRRICYRYNVETLADGSTIFLLRPTRLNKGCDFVIICENFLKFKNGNPKPPKQGTVVDELKILTGISDQHKTEILAAIRRVWDCEHVNAVIGDLQLFANDIRAERVLKLAKWLFIEQDVTYWTESGRHMLRQWIEEAFGPLP